ncbi:MAG: hypothetical protein IKC36_04950 [Clostridia bacterium]|nr:hypothetical protein [Clostridia bacterium]
MEKFSLFPSFSVSSTPKEATSAADCAFEQIATEKDLCSDLKEKAPDIAQESPVIEPNTGGNLQENTRTEDAHSSNSAQTAASDALSSLLRAHEQAAKRIRNGHRQER